LSGPGAGRMLVLMPLHAWVVSPARAREIQLELRGRVELTDRLPQVRRVAGADVGIDPARGQVIAGVVVFSFPQLEELERSWAVRPIEFPYIPGLLSFREMPVLLEAFGGLRELPDLVFYDGHGYAHPRRFGISCHLGVLLDRPAVGCAKSRLIGDYVEPASAAGSWSPLVDKGETIGAVVRTHAGCRPIFVSIGHRISLPRAVEFTLAVCDGHRIPRPTREADRYVRQLRQARDRRGGRSR
jgi:deoxyribonuclease V